MEQPNVTSEVIAIKHELGLLRELITHQNTSAAEELTIRLNIERTASERKPFLFSTSSPKESKVALSSTRAAIVLTLLLDLERRTHQRTPFGDTRAKSAEVAALLAQNESDHRLLAEQVRVAFTRLHPYWGDSLENIYLAALDPTRLHLHVTPQRLYSVEISTSDSVVQTAIAALGASPFISRLRKEKFLVIPGNTNEGERFLRDIYADATPLTVRSTYVRPQLITLPSAIADKYAKSSYARERHQVMHRRLRERTLSFTEIVPLHNLQALATEYSEETVSYSPQMTKAERIEHLAFLEELVLSDCGYRLVLTRVEIPFFVAAYSSADFTLSAFFRMGQSGAQLFSDSFFSWSDDMARVFNSNIFDWLIANPTTITAKEDVAARLRELRLELSS